MIFFHFKVILKEREEKKHLRMLDGPESAAVEYVYKLLHWCIVSGPLVSRIVFFGGL